MFPAEFRKMVWCNRFLRARRIQLQSFDQKTDFGRFGLHPTSESEALNSKTFRKLFLRSLNR